MESGKLIIDNRDIGTYYDTCIVDGGANELLSWPAAKEVDTEDWAESDFIRADLSAIHLAPIEATVDFASVCAPEDMAAMCSWLGGATVRSWNFASVGRTLPVRYVGCGSLNAWPQVQTYGVSVAIDSPYSNYTYAAPVSHIASEREYTLDGTPLSSYGVRVLFGTLDSTASPGGVKERLRRDVSVLDGVLYDNTGTNKRSGQEIVLRCVLIDTTFDGLWRNYDALLYDLVRQNMDVAYDTDRCKRALYSYNLDRTFSCYYKSQSVTEFYPSGERKWLLFDLTLGVVGIS